MAKDGDSAADGSSGSTSMTAYLEGLLKELELAQGCEDEEATRALAELKAKMDALAAAETALQSHQHSKDEDNAPDDMQLASALDRLDDRLKELEAELDSADAPTRQILQQSTELWLGSKGLENDEDDVNGPIKRGKLKEDAKGKAPP